MEKFTALAKDNKEIEVEGNKRDLFNSHYFIHDGKIWRWVSKSGAGNQYKLTGERESTKERITIKGMTPEMENIIWVYPQGHISL